MLRPTKHEDLSVSVLVVGNTILKRLKRRPFVAEDLYQAVSIKHDISLSDFFDTVTFLWCAGFIESSEYEIRIKSRAV